MNYTKDQAQAVTNSVLAEYDHKYDDYLKKKVAVNNHRTKEGLLKAINAGLDEFYNDNPEQHKTIEEYEAALRNKVERSTYFYINEPLIWRVVRKFDNLNIPESERYEAAAHGFVVAQNIFDPSRGFQFSTISWHIMCNEIIGFNKKYMRQRIIKEPDRAIICRDDATVTSVEPSKDARIVRVKGEPVDLYDIEVKEHDGQQHLYRYIYFPPEGIAAGYKLKRGDQIGFTAGVENEIASMNAFMDSDDHGDAVFHNPLAKQNEAYSRPDTSVMRDEIMEKFRTIVDGMTPLEQFVIRERLLPRRPKSRAVLAKEIGLTDAKLAKIEQRTREELKMLLEANGISRDDLEMF